LFHTGKEILMSNDPAPFPPHDPNGPDVNPATGDERETTGPTSADLQRLEGPK